ncbi:hypothetical protein GCM10020331_046030 [Ectobacillus funiculus]
MEKGVLEGDEKFVIWTTTPWTIPANLGISIHPELDYSVVKAGGAKYIIASALLESVANTIGWENPEVVRTLKGSEMEYVVAKHPLYGRDSLVMLGEHVTTDAGTGCVHTAPGHGEDDFIVGQKKYGLDVLCPVDDKGCMTKEAPGFEGLFYEEANKPIGQKAGRGGSVTEAKLYYTLLSA